MKFETKVSQPEQEKPGSHPRPESRAKADFEQPSRPPTVFGPGGKTYETANDDPMGRPEVDLKPRSGRSEDVGATAKAHAAKARPSIPEPKAMPDPPKATPRQPPNPPPSPRNQPGKGSRTTYIDDPDTTNDPSQSSQAPINPNQGEKRKADARDPKVDINNPITKIAEKVVGEDVIKLDGIIMDGSGNYIVVKDI